MGMEQEEGETMYKLPIKNYASNQMEYWKQIAEELQNAEEMRERLEYWMNECDKLLNDDEYRAKRKAEQTREDAIRKIAEQYRYGVRK